MLDQQVACAAVITHKIKHVPIIGGITRKGRKIDESLLFKFFQRLVVSIPDCFSLLLNVIEVFHLAQQERCCEIGGKKRTADIYPIVFVDLTLEKSSAIGSFFPDNLRPV